MVYRLNWPEPCSHCREQNNVGIVETSKLNLFPFQLVKDHREREWVRKRAREKFHLDTIALEHTQKTIHTSAYTSAPQVTSKSCERSERCHQTEHKIWQTNYDLTKNTWIGYRTHCPLLLWGLLTSQEFTKWDKHQIETLHAEICKNVLQRKAQNNPRRAELGRYPLIIKLKLVLG
jgi:hypothetical protein